MRLSLALGLAAMLSFSSNMKERDIKNFDIGRSIKSSVEYVVDNGMHNNAFDSRKEKIGIGVYDLTTDSMLYARNSKKLLQSASMIKPFIALAYYTGVEKKMIKHIAKTDTVMIRKMIEESDNDATTSLMRKLRGPSQIEKILKNYPEFSGKTDIVEYIPSSGKTYRNKSSVDDYIVFLNKLWDREFPNSEQLLNHMHNTRFHRLITEEMRPLVKVYNKTGSTAKLCGDMAIISYGDSSGLSFDYAIVAVIERPKGDSKTYGKWLRSRSEMLQDISKKVFENLRHYHELQKI